MTAIVLTGNVFRERYAVERLQDGGVLVDLATGAYSRLNVSATTVCDVLAHVDDAGSAIALAARRLGTSQGGAERAIDCVMGALSQLEPRRDPPVPFRYSRSPDGYVLTSDGVTCIRCTDDGTSVWLDGPTDQITAKQVFEYLRAVAPKLLFLQSTIVIHGAATQTGGSIRVIAGESGAGKTTTARAFDAAGNRLFAEDMLVIASLSPLTVYVVGESAINAWAAKSAEFVVSGRQKTADASELQALVGGDSVPVSEIWFIDRARRQASGNQISCHRLGETDGTLAVMTSLFLGATSANRWRWFLSTSGQIASAVPLFDAVMPAGLSALWTAAQSYKENSAS